MKRLSCRDIGSDCDFVACGKTEEEVLKKASEHGKTDHNMNEIPKEMVDKARSAIRNVKRC
jgi:predicted small metal-binding protein